MLVELPKAAPVTRERLNTPAPAAPAAPAAALPLRGPPPPEDTWHIHGLPTSFRGVQNLILRHLFGGLYETRNHLLFLKEETDNFPVATPSSQLPSPEKLSMMPNFGLSAPLLLLC